MQSGGSRYERRNFRRRHAIESIQAVERRQPVGLQPPDHRHQAAREGGPPRNAGRRTDPRGPADRGVSYMNDGVICSTRNFVFQLQTRNRCRRGGFRPRSPGWETQLRTSSGSRLSVATSVCRTCRRPGARTARNDVLHRGRAPTKRLTCERAGMFEFDQKLVANGGWSGVHCPITPLEEAREELWSPRRRGVGVCPQMSVPAAKSSPR